MDLPALYLSSYIIEYKNDYDTNLRKETEEGNWEDWILYRLDIVEQTALNGRQQIAEIETLMGTMGLEIQEKLPKVYSKDLIETLFRLPYTKIYIENT
jgi:Fic family protein